MGKTCSIALIRPGAPSLITSSGDARPGLQIGEEGVPGVGGLAGARGQADERGLAAVVKGIETADTALLAEISAKAQTSSIVEPTTLPSASLSDFEGPLATKIVEPIKSEAGIFGKVASAGKSILANPAVKTIAKAGGALLGLGLTVLAAVAAKKEAVQAYNEGNIPLTALSAAQAAPGPLGSVPRL